MPRRRKPRIELTNPQAIAAVTQQRTLRPSEVNTLSQHMAQQDTKIEGLELQISRLMASHTEVIKQKHLLIALAADGSIELTFPDQHSIKIPVGLLQHDYAIAMSALMRVLKDRAVASGRCVSEQGAPTQQDLRTILANLKSSPPVKDCNRKPKQAAPSNLSLKDLDLDLDF
jgi:hypothetical protein